jgi:mannose-6-phosphate isomerase-like protein (cupin superfamily)
MRLASLLLLTASPLLAQSTPTLHSAADLTKLETKLAATAKTSPTGYSSETIDDFGSARTMVVVRARTGDAELHQNWADQMVITKGTVILVTGGTIQGAHTLPNQPDETRGPGIEGGKEITLHTGDTVHIPAGLPHWAKVPPGASATYFVFKEK